jgi:hypothetical protein
MKNADRTRDGATSIHTRIHFGEEITSNMPSVQSEQEAGAERHAPSALQ